MLDAMKTGLQQKRTIYIRRNLEPTAPRSCHPHDVRCEAEGNQMW